MSTEPITESELDSLEALHKAGTPGLATADGGNIQTAADEWMTDPVNRWDTSSETDRRKRDSAVFVAARNALPRLIAAARSARNLAEKIIEAESRFGNHLGREVACHSEQLLAEARAVLGIK